MKNIILCDIDGTVADNDHRQGLLEKFDDWDNFFSGLVNDKPIHQIIELINIDHLNGLDIVFITGRPERYRQLTVDWLKEFFDFELKILMRADADKRSKMIVKREMVNNSVYRDRVIKVYENDDDLVSLWRQMNFNTIDINLIINI